MRRTTPLHDGWLAWAIVTCLLTVPVPNSFAQRPVHSLYRSNMPPGALGTAQAAQSPDRVGYVQPVRITAPTGAVLALACDGEFPLATVDLRAGLILGQPYRLRITNIPHHEDQELYPSVEIIDRLHPPKGQRNRFPIPIEITQDDLELALRGSMIVRVVYLENPENAFPRSDDQHQRYLDVLPSEDPLHVADDLGRPMAILRLGSRVPLSSEINSDFVFGSPPVEWLSEASEPLQTESDVQMDRDTGLAPIIMSPQPLESTTTFPDVQKLETQPFGTGAPSIDVSDPFIDDQSN